MKITCKNKVFLIKKSMRSIVNDLITLPTGIKILMVFLITLIILNNFFDLNYFTQRHNHPSIWVFKNTNLQLWKELILILSGFTAIAHIVCNVLLAYSKISNFFWGILGVISYGLYTIAWDYFGDMQLNLFFFLPMQFIGYNLWKKHLNNNKTMTIQYFTWKEALISLYAFILLCMVSYFEIPAFAKTVVGNYAYEGAGIKNIIPHLFDAATNALSVIGEVLMLLRFREQWIMWMVSNILQLAMFSGVSNGQINVNAMILWIFAIINAAIGLKKWFLDIDKKALKLNIKSQLIALTVR